MLSLKKVFAIGFAAFMLAGSFSVSNAQVAPSDDVEGVDPGDGGGGSLKVVLTNCVVVRTGEVVGHANDCSSGSSNCIDTTCN
jgi:hypothetical protein